MTSLANDDRRIVASSDLSRHSAQVFVLVEIGPVEVTRRDGETLLLVTKRSVAGQNEILHIAAQVIAIAWDERGSLVDRVAQQFPWIKLLKTEEQAECARSIVETARGAFAIDRPAALVTEIQAWRNTAEAHAAGWGQEERDWLAEPIVVSRPAD
jgi:hypothetical protein